MLLLTRASFYMSIHSVSHNIRILLRRTSFTLFALLCLRERRNIYSRKMRLYDQSSSTPMKLDGKKWMRPNNFLPNQRETEVSKLINVSSTKRSVLTEMTDNTNCCSETSVSTGIEISKVYKHRTIYDDFQFDIDEDQELSTKSSSTLSTHSTLRYVTHDAYSGQKKELPKPISIAKNIAFETNSRYSKTSSITTTLWENLASERDENKMRHLSKRDEDENTLNEDLLTPQLTLTQSSEESDSMWIEFKGFGSKNPFCATFDRHQPNRLERGCNLFSMAHPSFVAESSPLSYNEAPLTNNFDRNPNKVSGRYTMNERTGYYTKYYEMLLDGVSVDELSKIMGRDKVDPSIISLVLAASKSSLNP